MIQLFNRKKNPVDRVSFNHFDWKLRDNTPVFKSWIKNDQTAFIGVEYYETLFININSKIDEVVNKIRAEVVNESNGGLIECDFYYLKAYKIIQLITKEPQSPSGMSYIGRLIIPTQNGHYLIMLKICEMGTTGMRESVVFPKWIELNPDFQSDENGKIIGWLKDPFDNDFRKGSLMNFAENKDFDKDFPEHPLSELREKMNLIIESLNVN